MLLPQNIRNFSIIAHIDHGKSTLADRMIELTNTVSKRNMKDQVLDSMDLERERGITIKMQPVRMNYTSKTGEKFIMNLIDTPGHIDFSYEVSRALKAVEGSLLLVDSTQGVQAQTFTTLRAARELELVLIPVLTKIDSPLARIDDVKLEIAMLLNCDLDDILEASGRTGEGVLELLEAISERIPAPKQIEEINKYQGLVFDYEYSDHKGIIVYNRVFAGSVKKGDQLSFVGAKKDFNVLEVGVSSPKPTPVEELHAGEIGYIITGIKEAGFASVGDTLVNTKSGTPALGGYQKPSPVVWASFYPESQDDFAFLKLSLERLALSDSSFTFEEETSGTLGRGFRVGCLGMLHLEIISERLKRERNLDLIITSPTVTYHVKLKNTDEEVIVYSPSLFPDYGNISEIIEPWVEVEIIYPNEYTSALVNLLFEHEAETKSTDNFGDGRIQLHAHLPLRELMRGFFDELKSVSSGYASLSYREIDSRIADVVRMDIVVNDDVIPAFTRIVARKRVQEEGETTVDKLKTIIPRQMIQVKIQAKAIGKIWSSASLTAFRKDVTQHMYGGDISRKNKLRDKQKDGKKKMQGRTNVHIPEDVYVKMMK